MAVIRAVNNHFSRKRFEVYSMLCCCRKAAQEHEYVAHVYDLAPRPLYHTTSKMRRLDFMNTCVSAFQVLQRSAHDHEGRR
jgi:hypothetical protein